MISWDKEVVNSCTFSQSIDGTITTWWPKYISLTKLLAEQYNLNIELSDEMIWLSSRQSNQALWRSYFLFGFGKCQLVTLYTITNHQLWSRAVCLSIVTNFLCSFFERRDKSSRSDSRQQLKGNKYLGELSFNDHLSKALIGEFETLNVARIYWPIQQKFVSPLPALLM